MKIEKRNLRKRYLENRNKLDLNDITDYLDRSKYDLTYELYAAYIEIFLNGEFLGVFYFSDYRNEDQAIEDINQILYANV